MGIRNQTIRNRKHSKTGRFLVRFSNGRHISLDRFIVKLFLHIKKSRLATKIRKLDTNRKPDMSTIQNLDMSGFRIPTVLGLMWQVSRGRLRF